MKQTPLVVYPAPTGANLNADFSVSVKQGTGSWQNVPIYTVHTQGTYKTDNYQPASMALFDMSGPVSVSITYKSTVKGFKVRPLSYGIHATRSGNTISFTLSQPRKLSVEVNGDIYHNLHLFARSIETDPPSPGDPNVIYYGPGIHDIPAGVKGNHDLKVASGQTVYIAGGAIVRGALDLSNASNVKIRGRGIIDGSIYTPYSRASGPYVAPIWLQNCSSITISGITLIESKSSEFMVYGCSNLTLDDVNIIGCARWTDGIHVHGGSNITINDVFFRTADDCLAFYASGGSKEAIGDTRNIKVTNAVLWSEVGHAYNGANNETDANPYSCDNITLDNIDVLEVRDNSGSVFAIHTGDNSSSRNYLIQNVHIEDYTGSGPLFQITVGKAYNNTQWGRSLSNLVFKNVSYNGSGEGTSTIAGYSADRFVSNVTFDNLVLNGVRATDAASAKTSIGSYAYNISYGNHEAEQ